MYEARITEAAGPIDPCYRVLVMLIQITSRQQQRQILDTPKRTTAIQAQHYSTNAINI